MVRTLGQIRLGRVAIYVHTVQYRTIFTKKGRTL